MCNLYSMRRSRDELVKLFGITRVGNDVHFDLPDIYPDQMAPVIKQESGGIRGLTTMRWGFPPPPNLGTRPVTNVRNTKSPYWRGWLNQATYRCLVPATSFLRVDGRAAEGTALVCSRRAADAVRLRRHLAALDRRAQGGEGRASVVRFPHHGVQ
jgi:putative SOS response-associated peptidase YedK